MVHKVRRWLVIVCGLAVVVGLGWVVYTQFLSPDAETITKTRATNTARRAILDQDWETALSAIEDGIQQLENPDGDLLAWYAVLLEKTGTPSDDILQKALMIAPIDDVWITVGMVAILLDDPDITMRAGQALNEHDENSVQGHYLVGQGYDMLGDYATALDYFGRTLDLIEQSDGNEGLYITIRQRVAQINLELIDQELTGQ